MGQLTSMHFYGWKKGLKTGMYYLRTRPAAQAIQFTVDQSLLKDAKKQQEQSVAPTGAARPTATGRSTDGGNAQGIPTPSPSVSTSPGRNLAPTASISSPTAPVNAGEASSSNVSDDILDSIPLDALSLDDTTLKKAEADVEFAAALKRKYLRELEDAKLQCSLENKDACVMCSG